MHFRFQALEKHYSWQSKLKDASFKKCTVFKEATKGNDEDNQ